MIVSILTAALAIAQPAVGESHLVVVSGIGGDPHYRAVFVEWGTSFVDAAMGRFGVPESNIVFLAERPEVDPDRIDDRSTKANVTSVLTALADRVAPNDQIFVVFIGHGSMQGEESRFNLPGPDLTDVELGALFDRFPTQTIVFANTASASGDFLPTLSGPNRIIVTATKTGFERNETIFGGYFVQAFSEDVADVDKDERVSVLEAFNYARTEVRRQYDTDKRLLSEHAMLDDNGDGEGSDEPDPDTADGALARTIFLTAGGATAAANADPVLRQLYAEKVAIERQLDSLRAQKDFMEPAEYDTQLEDLLVELALKDRAIREREGREGR